MRWCLPIMWETIHVRVLCNWVHKGLWLKQCGTQISKNHFNKAKTTRQEICQTKPLGKLKHRPQNFHSRHDGLHANENVMPGGPLEGAHKQRPGICQDAPRDSTDATTRNSQRLPAGAEFGTGRDPTFFLELVLGYCCQWPASPAFPWGLMCSNPFSSWFMASKALFRLRLSPGLLSENVPCSRSSLAA